MKAEEWREQGREKEGRKEEVKKEKSFQHTASQPLGEAATLGFLHITATAKLDMSPMISLI